MREARYELLDETEISRDRNAGHSVLPSIWLLVVSFLSGVITTSVSFLCYSQLNDWAGSGQGLSKDFLSTRFKYLGHAQHAEMKFHRTPG